MLHDDKDIHIRIKIHFAVVLHAIEQVKSCTTRNVNAIFFVLHLFHLCPNLVEGRQQNLCFTGCAINEECNRLAPHDLQGIRGRILNEAKCKGAYVLMMWLLTYWPLGRLIGSFCDIFLIYVGVSGSGTPLIHCAPRFPAVRRNRCPKRMDMCPKTPLYIDLPMAMHP